ncbi:MAG TPA: ATP-binding protein, partial [Rhabdochlamydiaceae bacterium]|nr:ATP-binding protein [Rhabdochlamydiaceae bacterium]
YYLPRPNLQKLVTQFLENHIHVVLIGPRRFGKTSFIIQLLQEFQKQGYATLFIDVFNITSHRDFLQQLLRAIESKKSWVNKLKALTEIRPKLSADVDMLSGQPSLEIAFEEKTDKDVKDRIQDALESLEKLGKKVVIAMDEFQKISDIADAGWLEATLRTHMQRLKNVSFLFTGSKKSILYDMLHNQARPFYRSCQTIEFPSFGEEFTDWMMKKFQNVGIACERKALDYLRGLVKDTPNYVQMVGFHLVSQGVVEIGKREMDKTLESIVLQNQHSYQTLMHSLTPIQQRALRLSAQESKQVFSKEFLKKYEITSAPALASAIKALKSKGILEEETSEKGRVAFEDPLFAIWIRITL